MADDKDWTWVLGQVCPECGFAAGELHRDAIGSTSRAVADSFVGFLGDAGVHVRPDDETWSTLEYGCHIRDVFRVTDQRLRLMLDHDGAEFENWDQDATALTDQYDRQDPAVVAHELAAAGATVADRFDAVGDDEWSNGGVRSNGSTFTVETLGQYMAHDLVHHVWDIEQARSPE